MQANEETDNVNRLWQAVKYQCLSKDTRLRIKERKIVASLREILAYVFIALALSLGFVWVARTYAVYLTHKIDTYMTRILISFDIFMGLLCSLLAYLVYRDNKKLRELSDRCKKLEQERESKPKSEQA